MGILTKEILDGWLTRCINTGTPEFRRTEMLAAIDHIRALEADLLHTDALLENERRRLAQIRSFALEQRKSRGIGEHLRAVRKIAEMSGGGE